MNGAAHAVVHLVGKNADDGVGLRHSCVFSSQIDLLLKRVFPREVRLCEGFIDYGNKGSGRHILLIDHAAAQNWRTQGAGVVFAHRGNPTARLVCRIVRLPNDVKARMQVHPGKRRRGH